MTSLLILIHARSKFVEAMKHKGLRRDVEQILIFTNGACIYYPCPKVSKSPNLVTTTPPKRLDGWSWNFQAIKVSKFCIWLKFEPVQPICHAMSASTSSNYFPLLKYCIIMKPFLTMRNFLAISHSSLWRQENWNLLREIKRCATAASASTYWFSSYSSSYLAISQCLHLRVCHWHPYFIN